MNKLELDVSGIEAFLREKITDKNAIFVFSTAVVAQTWANWCVIGNHTPVHTVALERFIAWDDFKRDYLSNGKEDSMTVPAILRKLFVYDLIKRNSEANPKLFNVIINPDYADSAYSFSDWLGKNLPSLQFWKNRLEKNAATYGELDEEDKDFLKLYDEYKAFLEKNNLFEPSWIDSEELELKDKKHHFYIFYPEQLADFGDFEGIFSISDEQSAGVKNGVDVTSNVTALVVPKATVKLPKVYCYSDARKELRQTMLRIIELVKNNKADWSEITLNVPDIETYRPYLERELELYGIPFVMRAGIPLTKNCAGRVFKEINDCYNSDFSFDSVRALVLDECIPWKKTIELNMAKEGEPKLLQSFNLDELREELIREGNRMRCLCSFEQKKEDSENYEKIDIWEQSLRKKYWDEKDKLLLKLYGKIKTDIRNFFNPHEKEATFATIQEAWFTFKRDFIDENDFSSDANKILSRCITHLQEIITIEQDFIYKKDETSGTDELQTLRISSPYEFFLKELDSKQYTPQSSQEGISVFPYRVSAGAYFKYQFVIDGSQKSLDVPFKRLSFLNATKRAKLKLLEEDKLYNATQAVILMYGKKISEVQEDFVTFSFCENAFSGFSIPHSFLDPIEEDVPNLDSQDFIFEANRWVEKGGEGFITVSPLQKKQFENWLARMLNDSNANDSYVVSKTLEDKIKYLLVDSRDKKTDNPSHKGKIRISARGDMEKFFPCPRKWILSKGLMLRDEGLDVDLMNSFDMGNLNHKILELFMHKYENKVLPFFEENEGLFKQAVSVEDSGVINAQPIDVTAEIEAMFFGKEENIVEKAITKGKFDFSDSELVQKTLLAQKDEIAQNVVNFLKRLLLESGGEDAKGIKGIGNCTVVYADNKNELSKDMGDFVYSGKCDCVVKTKDKKLVIIDYKNSSSAIPFDSDFKVDEDTLILNDYQMGVYCNLLAEKEEMPEKLEAAYYYSIKPASSRERAAVFDNKIKDSTTKTTNELKPGKMFSYFAPSVAACNDYAKLFCEKIDKMDYLPCTTGRKPQKIENQGTSQNEENPELEEQLKAQRLNVSKYENCGKCNFKTICRTTFTVAPKNIHKI
ncbi:MAG: PD-(D/E)XK nuclease family protein [Treponema sp.]|nr:PD-(D/E)XK nuclease family protein [Treponema sp.]